MDIHDICRASLWQMPHISVAFAAYHHYGRPSTTMRLLSIVYVTLWKSSLMRLL